MNSPMCLHNPSAVWKLFCLHYKRNIKEIAGSLTWNQTPLDFVDGNGPGWAMNVQPFTKMPTIPPQRPMQRIPDDRFPIIPYGFQKCFLCLGTLLFNGIHVAGWRFSLPSYVENIVWRASRLILCGVTAAFRILDTAAS